MFGLSYKDLEFVRKKHDLQKKYLENNTFLTGNGQVKSLLDVSHSANHSSRYYSELQNKLNTIQDFINTQTDIYYTPIFLTITLDGFFRGFLYGDFSKYNENIHKNLIPNNDRFGYLQDKISKKEKFTIKDLYNCLNYQFYRFQTSNIFKKFKKQNIKIHYIKTTEPHKKDGVPHFHLLMYCPASEVENLKEYYKRYFPAPQNIRKLNKDSTDLKGFQTDLKSPLGYILKYVLKSFRDVKNEAEIDYLQAWYIKNRILRITTSHSIIPSWVYRKLIPLENDFYHLDYINKYGFAEWSKEDDYICFTDLSNGRTIEYNQGEYKLYYQKSGKIIKEFGQKKETELKPNQKIKLKYKKHIKTPLILFDKNIIKLNYVKPINKYNNYQLYNYYKQLEKDFNNVNLQHFTLVKNELIQRQIINDLKISPNEFKNNF